MTLAIAAETFQPEARATAESLGRFLERYELGSLLLAAPDGSTVALPAELQRLLVAVSRGMAQDRAITVSPTSRTLTTGQAAVLLGVSRPTVVKLIESGELPGDRSGHRRKIAFEDLKAYQRKRRREQYEILAGLAVDPLGDDDIPTLEELRAIRGEVAAARRARS